MFRDMELALKGYKTLELTGYGIFKKDIPDIELASKGYKPLELTGYGIFRTKSNGVRDTQIPPPHNGASKKNSLTSTS